MQQISSKQLKCYGRRNRAKAETTTSSLEESGPAADGDVRGGPAVSEEVQAPGAAAKSVQAATAEVVVVQPAKAHAGRGRPRKVVGGPPKQGPKSGSDGACKTAPTTRSSVGRVAAGGGREGASDPSSVEEAVSEGSSLRANPEQQPRERVAVRVRIVGPFSNGGSKQGGSKSVGSQKTRGQIARQESQRAADEETRGKDAKSEAQAGGEGNGEGQGEEGRGVEGNGSLEWRDAGGQSVGKGAESQGLSEKRVGARHRRERKDAEEQVAEERRDEGQFGPGSRAGGWTTQRERREQVVRSGGEAAPATETRVGGKSDGERDAGAGEEAVGRREGGRSVAEKSVAGQRHRDGERTEGGNSGRGREGGGGQGTLASRRWRLALQKRQREDSVLAQADDVVRKHEYVEANKDKKGLPKSKEPGRPKTHWDFVIEEMSWLAKDFERERKWKLSQAKKVAMRVNRSKLDVVARENRRLKEEEQRMRRVASNIAKDVKKFWLKVDKLVSYKQQLLVEERKKKALDKHLDFLLGQTERYSTMLAENLADTTSTPEPQGTPVLPAVPTEGLAGDGGVVSEQVGGDDMDGAVSMEVEGGVDVDFMVEDGEEQEDDEATLEADEALITEDERKEELSALQRESELPLEDLLKAYKLMRGHSGSEEEDDEDVEEGEEESLDGEGDDGSVEGEEASEDGGGAIAADGGVADESEKHGASTSEGAGAVASDAEAVGEGGSLEGRGGGVGSASVAAGKEGDTPGEGIVHDAGAGGRDAAVVHGEGAWGGWVAGVGVRAVSSELGAGEAGGNPLWRVAVELTHGNSESVGVSAREVKREERRGGSPKRLDDRDGELQDDMEYVPGGLADGNEEDDDERTLEEEERVAKEEGDGNTNEIDDLKRESEMPLEELLAKYRRDMNDDGEDSNGFWVDRRDRTSEAGTSGSESDEEDVDEEAPHFSEVRERMGEPSTSGRELGGVAWNGVDRVRVIDTVGVKEETVEAKLASAELGAAGKMEVQGRVSCSEAHRWRRNGLSGAGCSKDAVSSTWLLVGGGGDEVDAETAAAVAKVSEAARRRGDRVRMRWHGGGSRGGVGGNEWEAGAVASREGGKGGDGNLSPAAGLAVGEDEDVGRASGTGMRTSDSGGVAGEGAAIEAADVGDGGFGDDAGRRGVEAGSGDARVAGGADAEEVELGEKDRLADFAAAAQSAQPTGYTFSTTKVKTKLPFLLKHSLREYQHIGLDWLVTMYEKRLNGILADEMGLGKTIMTIALLAHLACEKGIWGPHLIVVPTSVMLNWETEFMKWCPAFKILTYFGSAKERKVKRQGWSRANSFHVCITTYRLVIQDAKAFKRKKWKYLILDEAHLIKNWKSQRWQTLLNFNSKRRILLTGTPLQNDLMELWSLMHFLMPHVFQSHQEFRDWFSNPITGMVEGEDQVNKEVVDRLHNVLRPFLLRRLKQDVEKQLPGKFEHVIRCRLSKRQRNLYEDFMASSDTQATLSSGNFLGLINVLMQLRKVCNHPDLFEGRPIVSSFDMPGMEVHLSSAACSAMSRSPFEAVEMGALNLRLGLGNGGAMSKWEAEEVSRIETPGPLIVELASTGEDSWRVEEARPKGGREVRGLVEEVQWALREERERRRRERVAALRTANEMRCGVRPVYGADLLRSVEAIHPVHDVHKVKGNPGQYLEFSSVVAEMVQLPMTRCEGVMDLVTAFMFAIPAARAPAPVAWCSHATAGGAALGGWTSMSEEAVREASRMLVPLRPVMVRRQLFFPDRRLLQFDCGKLQELAVLLRRLKSEGHRALIFTQMTKMLDVLESFINLYGYTYMRLDGSTKPEQRQILMQRFNTNPKIFLFILSTRSGGVGINLVGADTVIFYDSDWNPAMDLQAQDRCHRIGQTREVHIYRLISESTIEENILKKANQKRILDDLVIQSGSYNTEFFKKLDPMELFSGLKGVKVGGGAEKGAGTPDVSSGKAFEHAELSNAEVEAALKNAEDEADYMAMKRVEQEEAAENQEFTEELFAGNLDDEDLADDLDENGRSGKAPGDVAAVGGVAAGEAGTGEGGAVVATEENPFGESAILPTDADEEMDMLADVRQMAAAAAASGRGSVSFEDQLRPVERYAMRFLEVWDPRVDNLAVVAQVAFEEKEWELDQLEKLKEEQEAEIDEDNEPLFYETWDTALADEAYRQQVDILAQQQEQKQLEWEALEEEMRDADRALAEAAATVGGAENFGPKSRGKKKSKKAKFKSLAEGSLMSDTEENSVGEDYQVPRGGDRSLRDALSELMDLPHRNPSQRKRKAPRLLEEEMSAEKQWKKFKKDQSVRGNGAPGDKGKGRSRTLEDSLFRTIFGISSSPKAASGGRQDGGGEASGGSSGKEKGGKLVISGSPAKKGPLVMLEKERKKDSVRSLEHLPAASAWAHAEDAVLCAVVHEYGGNWQLASDALAGGPDGGVYRGRHRHPIHCRERFRQLLAQNAAAASGDPESEKSAQSAATNVQLRVTEEHTKRLLDAVLQLPDQELLLQRHFVAVLAAVKNAGKAGVRVGSDEPGTGNAPSGRAFVQLRSLVKSGQAARSESGVGKLSPRQVSAALAQAEREGRGVSQQGSSKAHAKEQVRKDPSGAGESDGFSVTQFLLGSAEYGNSPAREGERVSQAPSGVVGWSVEELLGLASSSGPGRESSKAVRQLAEILIDSRFRLATRIGWDGAARDWAAAGGSGTGVLGLHIPSKGRVVGKKRPAPDPSKPPKAKVAKTSRPDAKNSEGRMAGDEARPGASVGTNGEDSDVGRGHDGEANGVETESGAALGRNPSVGRKAGVKRAKKNSTNLAPATSPPGSERLDSDVPQVDAMIPVAKASKPGRKGGPGVGAAGAGPAVDAAGASQRKSWTKSSQGGQGANPGAGFGRGRGRGVSSAAAAVGKLKGGSGGDDVWSGRGIDLNGYSDDDDVSIVGVSAGSRFAADASQSPAVAPGRKSKTTREWTERPEMSDSRRASGTGFGGGLQHSEDSSLASHLMTRLADSGAPDLLSLGSPDGLSEVRWPPAAGAWPVALANKDLDLAADLGSLASFPVSGGRKPCGVGAPFRRSPPGSGDGLGLERGGAAPCVGRAQASEGATGAGGREQERGPTPAWMLGTQQQERRVVLNSQGQGAGASNHTGGREMARPVLRLGLSSPVQSVSGRRAPESPSGGGTAGGGGRPRGADGPQRLDGAGGFAGAMGQSLASPESPVNTGLGLSLGSGGRQRQAGLRVPRDLQRTLSPP